MFFFPFADENPTKRKPIISWAIIILCSLTFLNYVFENGFLQDQVFLTFGMVPALIFGHSELSDSLKVIPPILSIITSMFLHGGWMHLIGNMTYLYIFGDNVEETLGRKKFVFFSKTSPLHFITSVSFISHFSLLYFTKNRLIT